jgi:hypothetical protein
MLNLKRPKENKAHEPGTVRLLWFSRVTVETTWKQMPLRQAEMFRIASGHEDFQSSCCTRLCHYHQVNEFNSFCWLREQSIYRFDHLVIRKSCSVGKSEAEAELNAIGGAQISGHGAAPEATLIQPSVCPPLCTAALRLLGVTESNLKSQSIAHPICAAAGRM